MHTITLPSLVCSSMRRPHIVFIVDMYLYSALLVHGLCCFYVYPPSFFFFPNEPLSINWEKRTEYMHSVSTASGQSERWLNKKRRATSLTDPCANLYYAVDYCRWQTGSWLSLVSFSLSVQHTCPPPPPLWLYFVPLKIPRIVNLCSNTIDSTSSCLLVFILLSVKR